MCSQYFARPALNEFHSCNFFFILRHRENYFDVFFSYNMCEKFTFYNLFFFWRNSFFYKICSLSWRFNLMNIEWKPVNNLKCVISFFLSIWFVMIYNNWSIVKPFIKAWIRRNDHKIVSVEALKRNVFRLILIDLIRFNDHARRHTHTQTHHNLYII